MKDVWRRPVIFSSVAITAMIFVYQAFTTFLPIFLITEKDLPPGVATGLYGVYFIVSAIVQPVAGSLADAYGYRSTLVGIGALQTACLLAFVGVGGPMLIGILVALLGIRAGVGPVNNAYFVAVLPDQGTGAGYGLIRTLYIGIGSTGSLVVGVMADAGLFPEAFIVLATVSGVATAFYLALPRPGAE